MKTPTTILSLFFSTSTLAADPSPPATPSPSPASDAPRIHHSQLVNRSKPAVAIGARMADKPAPDKTAKPPSVPGTPGP